MACVYRMFFFVYFTLTIEIRAKYVLLWFYITHIHFNDNYTKAQTPLKLAHLIMPHDVFFLLFYCILFYVIGIKTIVMITIPTINNNFIEA